MAGSGAAATVEGPCGIYAIGGLLIELRDLTLGLRTSVLASERAVSQRGGTSFTDIGEKVVLTTSSGGVGWDVVSSGGGGNCCGC